MAYLKHETDYGIYDQSPDAPDPETHELGINSRNFGEYHLIAPQVEKLPKWAQYIWDNITVTPYGRLRPGFIVDNMVATPYLNGNEKTDSKNMIGPDSDINVIAQSAYIRKTLDRDDVVDITDFDIMPYLKKVMTRDTMLYIAACILNMATIPMSKEAIIPINDYQTMTLSEVMDGTFTPTGEETLFISPADYREIVMAMPSVLTREQFADLYGFKDVIFVGDLSSPFIFNVSKYYIGLPRGKDGDLFEDFNLDKNTKEVLYELKICGLYMDVISLH